MGHSTKQQAWLLQSNGIGKRGGGDAALDEKSFKRHTKEMEYIELFGS